VSPPAVAGNPYDEQHQNLLWGNGTLPGGAPASGDDRTLLNGALVGLGHLVMPHWLLCLLC
jgi:hypothetical protein